MIPQPYFNHDTDDIHHPKEDLYPSILKMMIFSPFQILEYHATCDNKMEGIYIFDRALTHTSAREPPGGRQHVHNRSEPFP